MIRRLFSELGYFFCYLIQKSAIEIFSGENTAQINPSVETKMTSQLVNDFLKIPFWHTGEFVDVMAKIFDL